MIPDLEEWRLSSTDAKTSWAESLALTLPIGWRFGGLATHGFPGALDRVLTL